MSAAHDQTATRNFRAQASAGAAPVAEAGPPRFRLTPDQRKFYDANGYVILPRFFDRQTVEAAKARVDELWAARPDSLVPVIDAYIGSPQEHREYFKDVDVAARGAPYKVVDMHFIDPVIQWLASEPRLMDVLEDLLTARPVAMHTLLLEFGSQQPAHFDTFYMPSPSPNMMAAAWVAIDPVTPDNGPLFYYPGSHLLEPFRFSSGKLNAVDDEFPAAAAHIAGIEQRMAPETFFAEPGDVLIWHAQLLHGGRPINDPRQTRLSLVTHYWTTHDYPREEDRIDLGDGRLLLRKPVPMLPTLIKPDELNAFLAGLATPAEDVAAAPPGFDPCGYLLRNPDIFFAKADPYVHYRLYGRAEGRKWTEGR